MKFFDMHADTLMQAFVSSREDVWDAPGLMLDASRLAASGALAQFFAIFMLPDEETAGCPVDDGFDDEYMARCIGILEATVKASRGKLSHALSAAQVESNAAAGAASALLSVEDARPLRSDPDRIRLFRDMGVRLITLTWNHENCVGYPNINPATSGLGLKDFGREAVGVMNDLGIIVDVSHLSDGGFFDVAAVSKKPFVASHSNCRSLAAHPRNLTDAMIRKLADSGGVAGLNFAPAFLDDSGKSTVERVCAHASHMARVGGIDCVALGSDLDGITGDIETDRVEKMPLLLSALEKAGFTGEKLEKIAWKNAMRVLGEAGPAR